MPRLREQIWTCVLNSMPWPTTAVKPPSSDIVELEIVVFLSPTLMERIELPRCHSAASDGLRLAVIGSSTFRIWESVSPSSYD